MRHPRRVRALPLTAVLATLLVTVLAACGSRGDERSAPRTPHQGSSAAGPSTSAAPSPAVDTARTFSQAQLTAALPTAKQVPGSKRLAIRCRFGHDTDHCSTSPDHAMARVIFSARSAEGTSEDHTTPHYWRPEEYDVEVDEYPDVRTAAKGLTTQYDLIKDADGHYSIKASGTPADERLGSRGAGRVQRQQLLGLHGVTAHVRQLDIDLEGHHSKRMQIAIAAVGWGRYRVVTSAFLYDEHHDPGDARTSAMNLLKGYLERLDRTT